MKVTISPKVLLLFIVIVLAPTCLLGQSSPSTLTLDGTSNNAIPQINLIDNMNIGGKSGATTHAIFGPYNTTEGDAGALYIGAGASPTGGRNDIILYNLGCNSGTCNVPSIQLDADTTTLGGALAVAGTATLGGALEVDGPGSDPTITLKTNVSVGSKAGVTTHQIFGPYNTTAGDAGALYIGAGSSPTGGRNDIILYNLACAGGTCNVPSIQLNADRTSLGGNLVFPDGSVQTKAQAVGPQGPAGPQGPQGPQGPAGPGSTSAVCFSIASGSANTCGCNVRLVSQTLLNANTGGTCTATANTGSCSANAATNGPISATCCVCAPN